MSKLPFIPETIVVHLGKPKEKAENLRVPFIDYIKNVASSEIYSTWPKEAVRANVYAQISYALNRVYTEWYPSKGYDFDITSVTEYDQKFIKNRNIYESINKEVNLSFNNYLRKKGTVNPYFAQYCSGTDVKCDGLSQWGTVELADKGMDAMEIIKYYYGDDIELVKNAPVGENVPSYPGKPLQKGDLGEDVRRMQLYLNRISGNFPAIPKIYFADGAFKEDTENAVKEFQKQFSLIPDGKINKATWYKIIYIHTSVKRLSELFSEGIALDDLPKQYKEPLKRGMRGGEVLAMQYFLTFIADFDPSVPKIEEDGIFGEKTEKAVIAFQRSKNLTPDGIVGKKTWHLIYDSYKGIVDYIGENEPQDIAPYPGTVLRKGTEGPSVMVIQGELDYLSRFFYEIPAIAVDGKFGAKTQGAVIYFQKAFDLKETGEVDKITWDKLNEVYRAFKIGSDRKKNQYPGKVLKREV